MVQKTKIKKSKENKGFWAGLLKDFLFVIAVVVIFAAVSKIAMGLYTPYGSCRKRQHDSPHSDR